MNDQDYPDRSDMLTVNGATYSYIAAGERMSSDDPAKKLLYNKGTLSIIIKSLIDDCNKYSYIEIGDKISNITGDRQVTADVNETGVRQLSTENGSVLEKLIRYDVYLNFYDKDEYTGEDRISTIDVEIQQETPSDYPLVKRGLYYAFRSVCSQLGDITGVTNYGKLHKVYSIWLMVKQDDDKKAGIVECKMNCTGDLSLMPERFVKDSDLVQVDFVIAGDMDGIDNSKRDLFRLVNGMYREPELLQELFTCELPEKSDFVKEADYFMTFEERFFTKGLVKGKAEGKAEGKVEGKAETKAEIALRLFSMGLSKEIISQGTDLSLKEIDDLVKGTPTADSEKPYAFS